jgi:hypothetical protein
MFPCVTIAFQSSVRGSGARSITSEYAFSIVRPGTPSDA